MRKFVFFPQWNYEKFELYLLNMESQGYQLCQRNNLLFCEFQQSEPEKVSYFITYTAPKDGGMIFIDKILCDDFDSTMVEDSIWNIDTIYRVKNIQESELNIFKFFREKYLIKIYLQRIALSFIFAMPGIFSNNIFIKVLGLIPLMYIFYCIVGVCYLIVKYLKLRKYIK